MADPVVHITGGIPDSGTGNITTLGQTLLDGANITYGATTDVAVAAGAAGSISAKLRSISRDIVGGIVLQGGGNIIGAVTQSGTWNVGITGTIAATQSGAWNVTNITGTISLPTGAATSAKQPALGAAGSPATDVITVQGIASMTPMLSRISDGTNAAAIKAASTAPLATDPALVVAISPNSVNGNGQATKANSAPVTIASDQGATPITAASNGYTKSRVNSAASTNATSVKASAGNVVSIDVFNNAAYAVFLKLYNKASSPTVGTDTPTWTIPVAPGGGFSREFPAGDSFATGIAYAITKLQPDSDTTVVAAGDLTGQMRTI
jgi:hypothetical protein